MKFVRLLLVACLSLLAQTLPRQPAEKDINRIKSRGHVNNSLPRSAAPSKNTPAMSDSSRQDRKALGLPRLVLYYQTMHDADGKPVSLLPLITEMNIALTHLIVCSLHISPDASAGIRLNDFPPSDPRFHSLWNETRILQRAGVKVMGMVGGAAGGSFSATNLDAWDANFELAYGQLAKTISAYSLNGMDLDVEQPMSLKGIERLVARLKTDFGPDFLVTLAPVASALRQSPERDRNLSGFDYTLLETELGGAVDFYNAQFYNGFGTLTGPSSYQAVVDGGVFAPEKVLAGQITDRSLGWGWVPPARLNDTVVALRETYGERFGGLMGWEYFDGKRSNAMPWRWAQEMTAILRPGRHVQLRVTRSDAEAMAEAWTTSRVAMPGAGAGPVDWTWAVAPDLDYFALVNE